MYEIINKICTIKDIIRWTSSKFGQSSIYYGHGANNCIDEALNLIFPSLFLPISCPVELYDSYLTYKERFKIIKNTKKRIQTRIPVSYLTNLSWFCGLEFYVDERVLIPRSPISELIVNKFYNLLPEKKPKRILDMCTGSACIAIACAYNYHDAEIDAVDISTDALKVAEFNIQYHSLEHRVIPILSNLFDNLPLLKYDLIISNPPYLDKNDINSLPDEFYFEPIVGFYSGDNCLKFVTRILFYSPYYLTEKGVLICEIGSNMTNLINKYPQVKFNWIKLINGGLGIFMLTRKQLIFYHNLFII